ncbi:hypothetical protein B0H17DRAFT_1091850 [Mycena rosella]|uniref:Required for respiratory growth protein 9, mitochondrial n=1 Tax=Mycena rosella TaxID=1033263 RepID=A0AAD7G3Q8_MYCRO|nr:hypothetical protein B0H17DRAFT_1091850 [Mycena rosella]
MFSVLRALRPSSSMLRAPIAGSVRCSSRSARSILDDDDTPVDLSEDNDAVDGIRPRAARSGPPLTPTPAAWQAHRATLKQSFPGGWNPPRKLSRDAMDGLRALHAADPARFPTRVLAERFRVSPEADRAKLRAREAQRKHKDRSLGALRERLEAQRVLASRSDAKAAMRREWGLMEDAEGADAGAESIPTRGIHARDKLEFE